MIKEKSNLEEIKERTKKYVLGNYKRADIAFSYGSGELLFDTDNKQYIDFMCGISVTNLGHSEADIIEAIRIQADKLMHTSNLFYSDESSKLAEVLVENSFPGKVFFCNSGTEANEAAFKLARKYALSVNKINPIILSLRGSFHGRTTASMSLTGQNKVRDGFGELLQGFEYIEPNDEAALISAFERHENNLAAIFMEPIIGEGGIIPISDSFAHLARKLTMENDSLLIFDEIQTGMGRTGKLFAFEYFGFQPDAMTLAKGLGSGFPIGALVIGDKYTNVLGPGSHGSTFGGNQLATSIAYETIKTILSRNILENVQGASEYIFRRLYSLKERTSVIKEIRGKGLHIGIEFTIPTADIAKKCLENGLIVNSTAEKVIRIMPPLNITLERVDEGISIFEKVVESL
ncbi:MAG: aspartate aminotransferase family protein [Leptospiraceae bacterium]|nr:aspartate aminotransferase family protein [Leptospiraceae bacterium]